MEAIFTGSGNGFVQVENRPLVVRSRRIRVSGVGQPGCARRSRQKLSPVHSLSLSDSRMPLEDLRQVLRKCAARQYHVAAGFLRLLLQFTLYVG